MRDYFFSFIYVEDSKHKNHVNRVRERERKVFFDILLEATSHWSVYRRRFLSFDRFMFESLHVNAKGIKANRYLLNFVKAPKDLKLRCTFSNHKKMIFQFFFFLSLLSSLAERTQQKELSYQHDEQYVWDLPDSSINVWPRKGNTGPNV